MKKITKQTYLNWYEDMLFWRKFEDKLAQVYINQKVRGFLHLYNGQEAVLAGALHAMDLSKDKMITAYRNHVQPIGMGVDPKKVMAELYGKGTGTRGGYEPNIGIDPINSLIGTARASDSGGFELIQALDQDVLPAEKKIGSKTITTLTGAFSVLAKGSTGEFTNYPIVVLPGN